MRKKELIECFEDTVKLAHSVSLGLQTSESQNTSRVYKEKFVSNISHRNERNSIIVENGTTFNIARKYKALGKIAVLNFANPENPGGGVQFGAMAQEECLCRSSNLYPCLCDDRFWDDYYGYHRQMKNAFYSDRLIYTKDIIVFKDDSEIPQLMPKEKWFHVDVITCAAPYLANCEYTHTTVLLDLFKSRIKNICEAAIDNHVDVLVLGAFGCGAFKNPPLVVAEAFRQVLCVDGYQSCFKQVVFAIKPTGECCPNLETFSKVFDKYAPQLNANDKISFATQETVIFHKTERSSLPL